MFHPYTDWLKSLGPLRADLPGPGMPMPVRGLTVSHTMTYPGNVTTATIAGSVKASPDATAELAVFTIGSPVFADGKTTWPISLSGAQTAALPADTDGNGEETFIYDLLLTLSGGTPQRIAGGLFSISGFVTEPA
jgi:hypothetical protein